MQVTQSQTQQIALTDSELKPVPGVEARQDALAEGCGGYGGQGLDFMSRFRF